MIAKQHLDGSLKEEEQWEGLRPRGEELWKRQGMKRDGMGKLEYGESSSKGQDEMEWERDGLMRLLAWRELRLR